MTVDLRLNNIFYASKDIFLNPNISRKARAIYISICFLMTLEDLKGKISLEYIAKSSGYNKVIARQAIKELEDLGFLVRDRSKKYVGLIK